MKLSTLQQRQQMHVLMRKLGLDAESIAEIKLSATNNRTESSKEMSIDEAGNLITNLQKLVKQQDVDYKPGQRQRRKIISICHDIRWFERAGTTSINIAALDAWLLEKGAVKKKLNELSVRELNKVVTQFENIQKKSYK